MTNILGAYAEDIDFQARNASGITVDTGTPGQHFRSSYARCALRCATGSNATVGANPLPGGAVTSFWLHFMMYSFSWSGNNMLVGLALSTASNPASGVYVGINSSGKLGLFTWDGTTLTLKASGTSTLSTSVITQCDMQVTSYGASATVNVYLNGNTSAEIAFSGSLAISGVSNLDSVSLAGNSTNLNASEIIVADSDTRTLSLCTLAPNANGDSAGSWTNTYTSINPTTINDANAIYNNATGSDFQCNVTDLPSGSFSILAVKEIARIEVTAGATPTGAKIGIKSGGTVNVDSGHTPGASWTQYERLMSTNPVTSAAFTQTEINALQLDIQSM